MQYAIGTSTTKDDVIEIFMSMRFDVDVMTMNMDECWGANCEVKCA